MKAYSDDLREKVLKALEVGQSAKEVAYRFDVSISWVYKISRRSRLTGSYKALPRPGAPRKLSDEEIGKLEQLVKENPSATLKELKQIGGFHVGITTIHNILRQKLKLTYKKTLFAAEQNREDVKEAREKWEKESQGIPASCIVCLDESNIKTSMVRLYGRGKRGQRVKGYIPDARWKSLSILSSLRADGSTEAIVYEGGLSAEFFKTWVKECLLKTLREGDVVIMDNMSSHKGSAICELIEGVGAQVRYLPPYSPDFNPVEMMWSKIKSELRGKQEVEESELIEATGLALKKVARRDAQGWYQHCGYFS